MDTEFAKGLLYHVRGSLCSRAGFHISFFRYALAGDGHAGAHDKLPLSSKLLKNEIGLGLPKCQNVSLKRQQRKVG